jgi:hypothetical protein
MAVMVHKLEQLNEDVSRIKPQFRRFLKAIYDGRLLPEALVVYQGCNNLLGALAQASPSTQQKLIDVGTVDINTHKGVKTKELDDLTRDELKQIIDPVTGELLPPEKQKLLEVKPREDGPCAVEIRLKLSRVEYDAFLAAAEDKKRSLEGFICETMRNTVGM